METVVFFFFVSLREFSSDGFTRIYSMNSHGRNISLILFIKGTYEKVRKIKGFYIESYF